MPNYRPDTANVATMRREQRFATRLPSRVEGGSVPVAAQLLDLSQSGALAEAPAPPPSGSKVRLRVDRFDIEAEVMWTKRSRFGLRFPQPLRATELLLLLSRGREAAAALSSPAAPPTRH